MTSKSSFSDPEEPRGAVRALLLHPEPHCVRDAGVQPEGARVRARLPAGRLLPRQVHVRRRHRHRGHGTRGRRPGTLKNLIFIPQGSLLNLGFRILPSLMQLCSAIC